jgi:hypothetical protein
VTCRMCFGALHFAALLPYRKACICHSMHACVHACPAHLVLLLYLSAGGQTSGRKMRCACSSLRQPWGSGTSRQPCRTCAPWRTAGRTRPSCGTALAGQAAVLLASAVLLAAVCHTWVAPCHTWARCLMHISSTTLSPHLLLVSFTLEAPFTHTRSHIHSRPPTPAASCAGTWERQGLCELPSSS